MSPACNPGTVFGICKIPNVQLQIAGFRNHLVARCDIENWRRELGLDTALAMGVCMAIPGLLAAGFAQRNSGFCSARISWCQFEGNRTQPRIALIKRVKGKTRCE